jgi:hypothetical protein
MNFLTQKFRFIIVLIATLLLGACATQIQAPPTTSNPPPSEALNNFTAFEIKPVTLAPDYADSSANQAALAKIQKDLSKNMSTSLKIWNQAGANKTGEKRTLVIEPVVTEIKFVGGGARFFVGPLAGSSAVIMNAKLTEQETGKIIATPEFYATAGAWSGTWSAGTTDNLMLDHIADQFKDYLVTNYVSAVGSPTAEQDEEK